MRQLAGTGNLALVPDRIGGSTELWDGWRLTLPNDCMAERNPGGSWSAWDTSHTIDVHILTVTATQTGEPMDATTVLGREPNSSGMGWIGHVEEVVEPDDNGPAYRFAIAAAAPNTMLSCWIAYREPDQRAWAEQLLASIEHSAPSAKRRLFGRK